MKTRKRRSRSKEIKKYSEEERIRLLATSPERDKPMCTIVWLMCKDCPDLIDHKCRWIHEDDVKCL